MNRLKSHIMQMHDLAAVMDIEVDAYPQPWREGIFTDCLKAGYQCYLYQLGEQLIGYSVMSVGAGEAHLLNLCIHPDHQGQGLGREVLEQVLEMAKLKHTETLYLEVRISNLAARRLYESAGFNEIGRRFNYYPAAKGREDALVFARTLL